MRPYARLLTAGLLLSAMVLATRTGSAAATDGLIRPAPPLPPTPVQEPDPLQNGDDEDHGDPEGQTILQTIIQTIFFPFETLAEGVRTALAELFSSAVDEALAPMQETLNTAVGWLLPSEGADQSLKEMRLRAWRAMATVAGILVPLALMITVGSAMREGVTSITGYANAREALLGWLIGVGAAAASYFLLEKAIDLSNGMTLAVGESMGQGVTEDWNLGDQLLGAIVNIQLLRAAGPLMQLLLGFFALFTMIAVVGSITIALLAREVLFILLVALAPVIFIMGSIQPLRWLRALWTKATVLTLLLGPANFLLLILAAMLAAKANAFSSGVPATILGMLIALGVISVLISLNSMVGKLVYGAALEIAKKAWSSTVGVLQLGAIAAGIAVAPALGGVIGASSALPAGGSAGAASGMTGLGAAAAGGAQAAAGGLISARTTASGAGSFGRSPQTAKLANSIGNNLALSRNPLTRAFGRGLMTGNALEAAKGDEGIGLPPPIQEPVDPEAGLGAAEKELTGRFAGDVKSAATFGLPQEQARGRIREGVAVGKNAFHAMGRLGVDPGTALRDLGYYRGANMPGAVASFGRVTAGRWALGHRSPYSAPRYLVRPGPEIGGHDIQAAVEIVNGPLRAEGLDAASPHTLSQLALTVHQRRLQLGENVQTIVDEASHFTSSTELRSWMKDVYYNLPNRESAQRLGQELGIVDQGSEASRFSRPS